MQENDESQRLSSEGQAFNDAYDSTMKFLEHRIRSNNLKLNDLEGEMHHLTIYEGQDWGGRGELKNSRVQGQIYAYMAMIEIVKKESAPKKG